MAHHFEITDIQPTPYLKRTGETLHQIARISIQSDGPAVSGAFHVTAAGHNIITPVAIRSGKSTHDVELSELSEPGDICVVLVINGTEVARKQVPWDPPRHWTVHVVQLSHHDAGYTDLASNVIPEHDRWLDSIIDMAEETAGFPEDARFRAVIEQTWSLDHYLHNAKPERCAGMIDLLKHGDLEMTALFGNMVTELCGHETLIRSIYHAFRLKSQYGIPVISAEHNDIPGFTWGLCQVLT